MTFFTNVGSNLPKKVPNTSKSFTSFLNQTHSIMEKISLSTNELKEALSSLKSNKNPRYGDINFDIVKKCFGEINKPLKHLLNLSLGNGIFPEKMKIAKYHFSKMAILKTLQTTARYVFFLVFLRCSSM